MFAVVLHQCGPMKITKVRMKITESQSQDPRWEPIDTLCLQALCRSTIQHFTSMKVDETSIPPTKKLVWSLLKVSCTYYTRCNIVGKVKQKLQHLFAQESLTFP